MYSVLEWTLIKTLPGALSTTGHWRIHDGAPGITSVFSSGDEPLWVAGTDELRFSLPYGIDGQFSLPNHALHAISPNGSVLLAIELFSPPLHMRLNLVSLQDGGLSDTLYFPTRGSVDE
jgi:hypothetical protein